MSCNRREFLQIAGLGCAAGFLAPKTSFSQTFGFKSARKADYWKKLSGGDIQCQLCPNSCRIKAGSHGKCRVRANSEGALVSNVYGNPCVISLDPVEKFPLFHYRLADPVFAIATAGCNLACDYCQNWQFALKSPEETRNYSLPPDAVIAKAVEYNVSAIAFFYTEPVVYIEYMKDIARLAKQAGLKCIMVTAGYVNLKPLADLAELIDAYCFGLKGFNEEFYRSRIQSKLPPVLESLKLIKSFNKHLEIVTLLVPGANDRPDWVKKQAEWLLENLGPDMPLHFTRFFPQYKLKNLPPTPVASLDQARITASSAGLKYVYTGNIPGHEGNHTYCSACGELLVERLGFQVLSEKHKRGVCGKCGQKLYGKWL